MAGVLCFIPVYFFYKRDEKREALLNGIYVYNSKVDGVPELVRQVEEYNANYSDGDVNVESVNASEKKDGGVQYTKKV
ncbi:unnamed protein product [Ambrosiozyma monospora]|uniref:Unnamed protein product n=1 Tax=Ambrosiozyma monospora TaxID=43982 RepID=A0ACB5T078_AMBMO|nr:unnamed protein product [Ambrosiozyma monospora]